MDGNQTPQHLVDQMTNLLALSIKETFSVLGNRGDSVFVEREYEKSFRLKFEGIRWQMLAKMKNPNGMDAHKLAALSALSVLITRPIRGKAHAVNEIVAFQLAIRIIRAYQVARYCDNHTNRPILEKSLGLFVAPDTIYDQQAVSVNLILSLRLLSRGLGNLSPVDVAFLLSFLFFYIDANSKNSVMEHSKQMGFYP